MENLKLLRKVRKIARQTQREVDPAEMLQRYYYAINRDVDDLDSNGFRHASGEGKQRFLKFNKDRFHKKNYYKTYSIFYPTS